MSRGIFVILDVVENHDYLIMVLETPQSLSSIPPCICPCPHQHHIHTNSTCDWNSLLYAYKHHSGGGRGGEGERGGKGEGGDKGKEEGGGRGEEEGKREWRDGEQEPILNFWS